VEDQEPILQMALKKAKETVFIIGNRRMIPVLFIQMYRGIVLCYYSSVLVTMSVEQAKVEDDPTRKLQAGVFLMIFFGIAEVLGGVVAGRLINALGKRFGINFLTILGITAALGLPVLVASKVPFVLFSFKGWPYYTEAALWGFADSSLNTSIIGLLVMSN
jgi:predicted MFS family arabinose efflux permease